MKLASARCLDACWDSEARSASLRACMPAIFSLISSLTTVPKPQCDARSVRLHLLQALHHPPARRRLHGHAPTS